MKTPSDVAHGRFIGASAKKIIDDAIVDATFVAAAICIGGILTAITPAGWGIAAGIVVGYIGSTVFDLTAEHYNLKNKYKKGLNYINEKIR